jgi:hypothetical protein
MVWHAVDQKHVANKLKSFSSPKKLVQQVDI